MKELKYKLLYNLCVESWKEDWDLSKHLSEKARTYIITIGLVFGYSIFNFNTFFESLEAKIISNPELPQALVIPLSFLIGIYFVCFTTSLLLTLISIWIRKHNTMPMIKDIAEFSLDGPRDEDLEKLFYDMSVATKESLTKNEKVTERQARYLSISIKFLTLGFGALALVGASYIFLIMFI